MDGHFGANYAAPEALEWIAQAPGRHDNIVTEASPRLEPAAGVVPYNADTKQPRHGDRSGPCQDQDDTTLMERTPAGPCRERPRPSG
jgi:hypothetical protein